MPKSYFLLLLSFVAYSHCFAQHIEASGDKVTLSPVKLVDPLIISERIDGPANVRRAAGSPLLLFILDDDTPVMTEEETDNWYRVGLKVELSASQYKAGMIEKGGLLYVKGKAVGRTVMDVELDDLSNYKGVFWGVLTGSTSKQNIKPQTLPENVLSGLIGQDNVMLSQFTDFIKGFRLDTSNRFEYTSYFLNDGYVFSPSVATRIELLFKDNQLFGILHRRKLTYKNAIPYKLNRGYYLMIIGTPPEEKIKKFIKQFNVMINAAD